MSLESFLNSLDGNQREQLKAAIDEVGGNTPTRKEPVEQTGTVSANVDRSIAPQNENTTTMKGFDNTSRRPVRGGENTFVDNGTESKGEEFETPDVKPVSRRSPVKKKNVACHVCGRKEKVSASLVTGEFYRCNRCTG